jgi:hypothetical protein
MGRKKEKKVSLKKLRYSKFKKEKSAQLDLKYPEYDNEFVKELRKDEERIGKQLSRMKNHPTHEIVERREKDKR